MNRNLTLPMTWSIVSSVALLASSECLAQARILRDIETRPRVTDAMVGPIARLGSSLLVEATRRSFERSLVALDPVTGRSNEIVPQLPQTMRSGRIMLGIGNGRAVFSAMDGAFDALAVTDGTQKGTSFLARIGATGVSFLVPFGARALFGADLGSGVELCITDGTVAGTGVVHDVAPGALSSFPRVVGVDPSGTRAVFTAYYDGMNLGVMTTDGTSQGTVILAKHSGDSLAGCAWLGAKNFVFSADDYNTGFEPWVSDGTPAGTRRIADLNPGSQPSEPKNFVAYRGRVFFEASPAPGVHKLYSTDGSTVTEVATLGNAQFGGFEEPVVFAGLIFFRGSDAANGVELWVTDGTKAGTRLFIDIASGATSSTPTQLTVSGSMLYFAATDSVAGTELYVTRGTAPSTSRVADIWPGDASSHPDRLTSLGASTNQIAFVAHDPMHGTEVWSTDGTAAGTKLHDLYDIPNATQGFGGRNLTSIGTRALFVGGGTAAVSGLWSTDGTSAGTIRILGPQPYVRGDIVSIGSRALFVASAATLTLYETDGTILGTKRAQANVAAEQLSDIGNGRALFVTQSAIGVTDGTVAGTVNLMQVPANSLVHATSRSNGAGVFTFSDNAALWLSDGSVSGTRKVFDYAAYGFQVVHEIVAYKNGWLFTARDGAGLEPWFTDGTARGTRLVRDIDPGPGSSEAQSLCVQDGFVWFTADDGVSGPELWVSDGTWNGTKLVLDAAPGPEGIYPRHLTAVGRETVYFDAYVPGLGIELCRYDVRAKRISIAADIQPGVGSSMPSNSGLQSPRPYAVLGNEVLFTADDGVHAVEPYVFKHGAVATVFGHDCGVAALDSSTDPHLGTSVALRYAASSTRPGLHILCLGGPDYGGLRLDSGCHLHLDLASFVSVAAFTAASWSRSVAVPAQTSLLDVRVAWQAIVFDLGTVRYGASRGVEWTLGR
ncbi:MAG: hypothetical protein KDC95_05620 [Planctomycetes bacterium]|nr:hypothetical protein [Planctomycetota bacterium]